MEYTAAHTAWRRPGRRTLAALLGLYLALTVLGPCRGDVHRAAPVGAMPETVSLTLPS